MYGFSLLFFIHGFNGCHDLMLCVHISDIAIITVKGVDYRFIIHGVKKSEAVSLLKNYVVDDRGYI